MNIGTIIGKVGQRRQVVIPKNIFEKIGLNEGDFIEIKDKHGSVMIKPQKFVGPGERLTHAEKKSIIRGFRDIKRGHSIAWKDLKRELGL
ncbi:MAG: AbrB/MazE/SpoVT family DNA-binding domain-containing protein [Candidatus Vogelbacteria bacterium]|nr:AbrB/MazE/SpoVT family DNA-binding domain-containing protein [Candidatus Vogelbacteria bacterium]